jgi:hypothetical protein
MPSRLDYVLWELGRPVGAFPFKWTDDLAPFQEALRDWTAAVDHERDGRYGIVLRALGRQGAERRRDALRRTRAKRGDSTAHRERNAALHVASEDVAATEKILDEALDDYASRSAASEACVVRQNLAIFRVLAHRQLRKVPAPREVAHAP